MKLLTAAFMAVFSLSLNTRALPNPASQNCIAKKGSLEIRRTKSSAHVGICVWKTNYTYSECEEWALFRGTCKRDRCVTWNINSNICDEYIF